MDRTDGKAPADGAAKWDWVDGGVRLGEHTHGFRPMSLEEGNQIYLEVDLAAEVYATYRTAAACFEAGKADYTGGIDNLEALLNGRAAAQSRWGREIKKLVGCFLPPIKVGAWSFADQTKFAFQALMHLSKAIGEQASKRDQEAIEKEAKDGRTDQGRAGVRPVKGEPAA